MPYALKDLYSTRHAALVEILKSNDFPTDKAWKPAIDGAKAAVVAQGFNVDQYSASCVALRAKVEAGQKKKASAAKTMLAAAGAAEGLGDGSVLPADVAKRLSALETLRRLWLLKKSGSHKLWVLSLPMSYGDWPEPDIGGKTVSVASTKLNDSNSRFKTSDRKHLSDATQNGLAWIHKAMIVTADPSKTKHMTKLKRWFADESTTEAQLKTAAATLNEGLKKMAATIKSSFLLMTDMPMDRSDAGSANTNAFVFSTEAIDVIYIERAFFGKHDTWKDLKNWTRIVVHELSHRDAATKDHRYRHHASGLKPNSGTFSHAQAIENADSWAIFCMDCAGVMTKSDYKKVQVA